MKLIIKFKTYYVMGYFFYWSLFSAVYICIVCWGELWFNLWCFKFGCCWFAYNILDICCFIFCFQIHVFEIHVWLFCSWVLGLVVKAIFTRSLLIILILWWFVKLFACLCIKPDSSIHQTMTHKGYVVLTKWHIDRLGWNWTNKTKNRCLVIFDWWSPSELALTHQWIHLFYLYPEEDDTCASDTSSYDLLGNNRKL